MGVTRPIPRRRRPLAWLALAALLLAGCASPDPASPAGPGSDPYAGDDAGPGSGADESEETPARAITTVTVIAAPAEAEAGSEAVVCWRVEGHGVVPHTAVHAGNTSHPGEFRVSDYPEPHFPNNGTHEHIRGYELPGDFCTAVEVRGEDVYLRAHARTAPEDFGVVSPEHVIRAAPPAP